MQSAQPPPFDGKAFVRTLTTSPGVYRHFDAAGELLYVGKAGNLRKRVGSYFLKPRMEPRIAAMVAQIARVEITVTRTEGEALLLESQLIKSLKPRYNILLRDDKSYPYIYLSSGEDYPRLAFHRGAKNLPGRYFGPYPSTYAVRESLSLMQKLFKVRQCEDSYFRNRTRPCLQYQIGRCSAPCVGLISVEDYRNDVRHAEMFLEGRSNAVIDELAEAMEQASKALQFERAAKLRDQVAALRQLQAQHHVQGASADMDVIACRIEAGMACVSVLFFRNGISLGTRDFFPRLPLDAEPADVLVQFIAQYYLDRPVPRELILGEPLADQAILAELLGQHAGHAVELKSSVRGERAQFLQMAERNAQASLTARLASRQTLGTRFDDLQKVLGLAASPRRIECFDISHTMGELTVASCVVFGPEGPEKSHYRRFNISGITPGDDYAAMHQALTRRFRKVAEGEGARPDVLLIDGGGGQVAQALDVLKELGVDGIQVVGVAKGPGRRAGEETLVLADSGRELHPGSSSPALHLVAAVRDEAHRFAISGHRKRREKARERSVLEDVPGIGARRRSALLKAFGGMQGLERAGVEELMQVKGIDRGLAERIYASLHG
ncbi:MULTISPECIES: excinuclease ABC subunit UvrC [unclassified Rhodanobacter]|uniref:excinuclease ABC subunit UvrC n=1 Tax=unclassified Rhodanobacter TaxID=2621553 RepID=UPI0007A9C1A5|nr:MULTISPECIES: excinuclease ABC subunit UvrC [unclassified Rhodanobacter]KZC16049.1 excinuclease ABC subunit C [Rhodanobacter sp. FW104-R8]KZC26571.1 excinuclease ABC subunit C [Rhodanobacter sp. FW510-T8]KZC30440.1 excinuclease ABC subunit C [Rhodanobacter sp. FW510-R10]